MSATPQVDGSGGVIQRFECPNCGVGEWLVHHHNCNVDAPLRVYIAVDAVESLLHEVSRDYAGAHVNAGSVTGSVHRRLKEITDA